jgi:predicted esterase
MRNNWGELVKRQFTSLLIVLILAFQNRPNSRAADPNICIKNEHGKANEYVYIYAHGLGACYRQGIDFFSHFKETQGATEHWIADEPFVVFDFPDAKPKESEYHAKFVNLGQQQDIDRLEYVYNEVLKQFPQKRIILLGLSRGAATIINFVALKQPNAVAAIVLESPFDNLRNIIIHLMKRYHVLWLPYARQLSNKITQKHFPSVDINGLFPVHVINRLPHQIPIIFIHCQKDKVVPINSSRKLYAKLISHAHPNAYLLELNNGLHGKLLAGNDGPLYQNVVHAFYKRYGLPHNSEFAKAGETYLTQPTLADVLQRITKRCIEEDDE